MVRLQVMYRLNLQGTLQVQLYTCLGLTHKKNTTSIMMTLMHLVQHKLTQVVDTQHRIYLAMVDQLLILQVLLKVLLL